MRTKERRRRWAGHSNLWLLFRDQSLGEAPWVLAADPPSVLQMKPMRSFEDGVSDDSGASQTS